jgi:beta-galactosidase
LLPVGEVPDIATTRLDAPARIKPILASRDHKGIVTLVCATADAKLVYQIDGSPPMPYAGTVEFAAFSDRSLWSIVSCDSVQKGEGESANAIDGDDSTYWHTQWQNGAPPFPHQLVVDFGKDVAFQGLIYVGRGGRDGASGRIKDFEIYISKDGKNWGTPTKAGILENRGGVQRLRFDLPVTARYLKFIAKSDFQGKPWAALAELDLIVAE